MNAKFVAKTSKDGQIQGLATNSAPALYFYHPDHLGSTAMVTDFDGHITQNVVYIPYGEVFVEERNGSWTSSYLFNAKELDEETGLYYYGARYLDPAGARWLSVDPLWYNNPDKTPYNYCLNNPVKLVDPDGRDANIEGDGSKIYVLELQRKCSGIKLSLNGKELKYDRIKDENGNYKPLSKTDNKIISILEDHTCVITIDALRGRASTFRSSQGELYSLFGGAFCGNEVKLNEKGEVEKVNASQVVVPLVLREMDNKSNNESGTSALHELTEAYEGCLISKRRKVSSPRAGLPGSVYEEAHKAATKQPNVRSSYLDENGNEYITPNKNCIYEQFQVEEKVFEKTQWNTIMTIPYIYK